MEDLNDKVTGGTLTAAEWNQVPSEIQNVIEGLGITLSSGDLNQLGKAIAGYVANGTFYTDSGAADAYVLTQIGSKQAPTAYTDGFEAEFETANPNAGATTVNVAGLGVKAVVTSLGVALAGGEIIDRVKITFDSANDRFVLTTQALFSDFAGASNLLAGSGFQKLPGGLIVQWASLTAISPQAVLFPITFPNSVFIVVASQFNNAVLGNNTVDTNAISVTGFTAGVFVGSTGAGNTRNISYIAIGN